MMIDTVQDHIHLSDTLGGSPEFAPTYIWTAKDRKVIPTKTIQFTESLGGYIFEHVVGNDTPVKRKDMFFEIKLMGDDSMTMHEYEDLLLSLDGRRCYFCDNFHPDNGSDHTADIRTVVVDVQEIPMFTTGLFLEYVPVLLRNVENPS